MIPIIDTHQHLVYRDQGIANNELDPWREDIESLSKISNVTCKLSGLMAYCAPGTSSYETIEPYVDHVLKCFGPNRIVWGVIGLLLI